MPVDTLLNSRRGRHRTWLEFALMGLCALIASFFVAPVFIVIPLSFSSTEYFVFPPREISLTLYREYFGSYNWMRATATSFQVAAGTMLAATVIGTLAAVGLARMRGRGKGVLNGLIVAPMIVPHIILAIALYGLLARWRLIGTVTGLILAHTMLTIPFVVITVSAALRSLDPSFERAAQSLGATPARAFWRVTLPLILPGVLSGALFAFIISFDEVVLAIFISGSRAGTLPKVMFESIRYSFDIKVAAVSSLLIVVSFSVLLLTQTLRRWTTRTEAGA